MFTADEARELVGAARKTLVTLTNIEDFIIQSATMGVSNISYAIDISVVKEVQQELDAAGYETSWQEEEGKVDQTLYISW